MIDVRPLDLPHPRFPALRDEAAESDGRFLARLEREWEEGRLRFDRPGELLLGAFAAGRLVGLGGISLDPYDPAPGLGRLRHLYVAADSRRQGIGRTLVAALVEHARGRFEAIRLRTEDASAARLYEKAGFAPSDGPGETHRLVLVR